MLTEEQHKDVMQPTDGKAATNSLHSFLVDAVWCSVVKLLQLLAQSGGQCSIEHVFIFPLLSLILGNLLSPFICAALIILLSKLLLTFHSSVITWPI